MKQWRVSNYLHTFKTGVAISIRRTIAIEDRKATIITAVMKIVTVCRWPISWSEDGNGTIRHQTEAAISCKRLIQLEMLTRPLI
jgi:hypothetical protein